MSDSTNLWIGTNWKMNKTRQEAKEFAEGLGAAKDWRHRHIQPFIIPPFTLLSDLCQQLKPEAVKIGAQNMHHADAGAWTGEISPVMLKDCGVDLVVIGHSERRTHFGENDEDIALKVRAALGHGLIPIICVGETLKERESGQALNVLNRQISMALGGLDANHHAREILFAYEPVWAIGAQGKPATPDYANTLHQEIGQIIRSVLKRKAPCLYGGSVNLDNCAALVSQEHIDGLFIGRAGWNVTDYIEILRRCAQFA